MHPVLFEIFGIKIYSYGLLMAVGILGTVAVATHLAKKDNISVDSVYDLSFIVVIFSILGARVFYVLNNIPYYLLHPAEIFLLNRGGLVFYGGLVGGFIAAFIFLKRNHLPIWKMGDLLFAGLPLGQAFGRMGCFLNGCCFGLPTAQSWGIIFPPGRIPFDHYGDFVSIHPVQLYNSAINFLIFLILSTVYEDKKFDGLIIILYGMLYATSRFITEFYRGDVPLYGPFTIAQWISSIVILFSLLLYRHLSSKTEAL